MKLAKPKKEITNDCFLHLGKKLRYPNRATKMSKIKMHGLRRGPCEFFKKKFQYFLHVKLCVSNFV